MSNFAGSGQDYSFSAVPDSEGVVTIDIAADAATDDVGNGNLAANTYTVVYDTTAPGVQISSSVYPLTQTSPVPFTLNFDEKVAGLDAGDIDLSHGLLTDFVAGGNNYSLSFDGVDDYVDFGNILNFNYNDPFTIAYWFKVGSGEGMMISNKAGCDQGSGSSGCHRGYELYVGSTLNFYLSIPGQAIC